MNPRTIFYLLVLSLLLAACNLPGASTPAAGAGEGTLTPEAGPLGTEANPIVMAIRPGATREAGESAARLAGRLSSLSGLVVVARDAKSYTEIVEGLGAGRVHVAWLPPLAYLLAHENGDADAALATIVDGRELVATQFVVSAARLAGEGGFKTYFDPASGENVVEPAAALAQFAGKRPCWSDAYSAVGYVLPLEILTSNGVAPKTGSFLQGEATVVATLYRDTRGDVCDFGATTADARAALTADLPDVMDKVAVVWRGRPVVPNDALAYASVLPDEVRIHLTAAFLAIAGTEDGMADLRAAYGAEGLKWIDDSFFNELRAFLAFPFSELPSFVR